MPDTQPKPPAPYLPWRTFYNSLETFSQGIPPRIDRTIWRQSGLMQGLIFSAYRFFGLIDDNSKPTMILLNLLQKTDERPATMAGLLRHSYPDVMAHDLTTLTQPMLDELIEKYNVSGATKKKAITFFLQAAKYAGIPLSPFIQVRSTSGARRAPRRGQQRIAGDNGAGTISDVLSQQQGSLKTVQLKSGGEITLAVSVDFLSMAQEDRNFVFQVVDLLRSYEQQKVGSAVKTGGAIK